MSARTGDSLECSVRPHQNFVPVLQRLVYKYVGWSKSSRLDLVLFRIKLK